eukprot:gene7255-9700_t
MGDSDSPRKLRETVSRSYATENKVLDAIGEEADVRAKERRRKREEARALRLQEKLNQVEKEQRSKEDAEYRQALEVAKKRAQERRDKTHDTQLRTSEKCRCNQCALQDVTETLLEVDALCQTILKGPDSNNQSVQALYGRVRLLSSQLRDTLLHVNRLQNHKITVQYEREKQRDRYYDLEEELSEAKAEIRQYKDSLAAERASAASLNQRIATLEYEYNQLMEQNQQSNEQATLVNTDNSAITESNPIIGSLESEIEMLRLKNKQLSESLQSQATEELNKAKESQEEITLNVDGLDPQAAANRIRHLEKQSSRLKDELRELENLEEEQRSENKRLKREIRSLEADKESLEELIKAKDEQLKKLRDRRRLNLAALGKSDDS